MIKSKQFKTNIFVSYEPGSLITRKPFNGSINQLELPLFVYSIQLYLKTIREKRAKLNKYDALSDPLHYKHKNEERVISIVASAVNYGRRDLPSV